MNTSTILFRAALLSGVLSLSAFAAPAEESPAASRADLQVPQLVKLVRPTRIDPMFENATIKLAFTIDAKGVPHYIRSVGRVSPDLMERLVPVVQKWRFKPAVKNGQPVAIEVIMPVQLVAEA